MAADFREYGRNKLLIIKDRYSGLIRVYTLPDMSMKSATRGYLKWAHSYGIAAEIRTDGGPGFGSEFSEGCKTIGTNHIKSSAYNPASNGAAERGVGQIKSLLEKLGKKSLLSQDYLNMIVFKINSHVTRNQGSALMRFFGREVVTYMPTLVKKRFDQAALIQKRAEQQMQVAKKLGRRSVDTFKTGDLVVAQNARTGKWTIRGRVTKARTAEDGTSRSFKVETEAGKTTLRNARHLRHQSKKMNVSFSADVDSANDDEAHVELDTSSLVTRPDRVSERLAALRKRL